MLLPSARRLRDEIAAREAAGENVWTDEFDQRTLTRIAEVWEFFDDVNRDLGSRVGVLLRGQIGWQINGSVSPRYITAQTDPQIVLDLIGAVRMALGLLRPYDDQASLFEENINAILRQHRIAHKFVEGQLIPFTSDELMQEAVEPALRLMVGDKFKAAHDSYLKALTEISNGDAGDAIKDAGTALQEALTALECEGEVLSTLIKDAKTKGLLKSYDQQLEEAVALFMKWAASERNKAGGTHQYSDASVGDAWLMVHVVGALIVRLADPNSRGSTP